MLQNPLRKAMIVIAVSNYNGSYSSLPGTLNSAKRIANWAREPGPGRGYDVLEITDADGAAVSVERLRNEIEPFLQSKAFDRLVVYFAGHGLVRSTADQYWLLTDAENDTREGVDMNAFKRGLTRQGIGSNHPELNQGQLCFIVDACRNTSVEVLDFAGDPIVTSGGASARMQIDLFFATSLGEHAYQLTEGDSTSPYCLFSEILTDALEGQIHSAIEFQYHPFKPVISNNRLADYLESEVPKRAAMLGEEMQPDINTLIRLNHNYYDVFGTSGVLPKPRPSGSIDLGVSQGQLQEARAMNAQALRLDDRTKSLDSILDNFLELEESISQEMTDDWSRPHVDLIAVGSSSIAVPRNSEGNLVRIENGLAYAGGENSPIFVNQGDRWLLVPFFDFTGTYVTDQLSGDVFLRCVDNTWDLSLSSTAALTTKMPPRVSDALIFADEVRFQKSLKPNNANIAGYLYDFVGDMDNVRRTAHYMSEGIGLPIDLAILAATKLYWKQQKNGRWEVFADIPAVEAATEATPTTPRELSGSELAELEELSKIGVEIPTYERAEFTRAPFDSKEAVPVLGTLPAFRRGWQLISELEGSMIPTFLQEVLAGMSGGAAVLISTSTMLTLAEKMNYEIKTISEANAIGQTVAEETFDEGW
jgi:hypothetical protein